jgi:hypothetical protein
MFGQSQSGELFGDAACSINIFACAYALLFSRRGSGSLWNVVVQRSAPVAITLDMKLSDVIRV